jgi:RNA recognition motif-containing protein
VSKGTYSPNKRQRENDKARKKRDKADRRWAKRERGAGEIPVTTREELIADMPTVEEAMRNMERRKNEPRAAAAIPARLFVGGLSRNTTSESLREAFEAIGPVVEAIIVTDRDTGDSRGFGFVTMENRRDAKRVIDELSDTDLDGRTIVVNTANDR